ncbi:unnamed protein product [Meganyctiphanes norvegica]|uniref:DUF7153 domain-containing protein n=1 Tax=Meganyctiphanes norvegica TaxID=48144 RepID=A0AAV2Q433_MEGNR
MSMYAHDWQPLDKKALGAHFTILQGYYTEHARLTLILKKGNERVGPHEATHIAEPSSARRQQRYSHKPRLRNQLVLAYKSFEESTDPTLLAGWVRWSGAWEAYTLLQDRRLPVSSITLYVRESSVPPDVFKYVVLLEVETTCAAEVQQLRAATQRLRVERWSGFTCLYTLYTLTEFADSFSSNDSISKIVGDIM